MYIVLTMLSLFVAVNALALRTNNFTAFTYESNRRISVEERPINLSNWQLQNSENKLISLSDFSNEVILVDFVYTRCPTICRALGSRYEQLQREIKSAKNSDISLLSISIDPDFDTPERLAAYQSRYTKQKDSWHLARPVDDNTLQTVISEIGLRVIPDDFGGFVHSEAIHLINNGVLTKLDSWDSPIWKELINENEAL